MFQTINNEQQKNHRAAHRPLPLCACVFVCSTHHVSTRIVCSIVGSPCLVAEAMCFGGVKPLSVTKQRVHERTCTNNENVYDVIV